MFWNDLTLLPGMCYLMDFVDTSTVRNFIKESKTNLFAFFKKYRKTNCFAFFIWVSWPILKIKKFSTIQQSIIISFWSDDMFILEYLPCTERSRIIFSGFQYLKRAEASRALPLDPTRCLTDPHRPQLDW